ncbi:MAG: methionine--tRNA ligase [Clostridia bacterium]|nr:methionine--tRNA ligase [Clostridia bacterium]
MENKKFYITTPIYYPSGRFHIGTAYATTLADCINRYKKLQGYETYFLTGTDEHGQKIQTVAEKRGITPQEHVDEMAESAKKLWKEMNISNNDFIRTTEERHEKAVDKIIEKFIENGDIYKGFYEGWYCVPCENYFTELQLVNGKCPDCGREVKKMKEESYFFNMKKYQSWIENFYEENPNFIVPDSRRKEILNNFIKPGLDDLCISRTTFDWGIKIKSDPKHVLYVWVDALSNYITALGYLSEDDTLFKKYWPADIQIVGKEIIRFHGIYWPIFLKSLGLELPKKIYGHSWLVMKDGKMSKSVGNVIYPEDLIKKYGLDATRYYLLRTMQYATDSVFTPEDFIDRYNFDLCNDLGNLLNRTIGMINKYFNGYISKKYKVSNDVDIELEEFTTNTIDEFISQMDDLYVSNSLSSVWKIVSRTNKYIDETTPWILAKDESLEAKEKLKSVMYHLAENLRKIAILISPFMVDTSEKIFMQLGFDNQFFKTWNFVKTYLEFEVKVTEKGEPLFLRKDREEEIEYIKNLMK